MSYLLDTDTISNLLRRVPSTSLIARLAGVTPEEHFTSSITVGELLYGAYRLGLQGAVLRGRLEALLTPGWPVLPFDRAAAQQYAELRATLQRLGTPIGDADLRIAAIALTHQLIVVTANTRHFARVPGLTIENWLAA